MKASFRAIAIVVMLSGLSSCGRSNPIIGKWTAKDQGGFMVMADVEFTPTDIIIHDERVPATYQVDGKTVTVTTTGMQSMAFHTCVATDSDTIQCNAGTFVRIKK